MKKLFIAISAVLILHTTTAQSLITVKQDGTGNFTYIQEAIDASNDGDTILVWPGIYYEHIYAYEKNFILGSLTLTTGDPAYISQTIIDGMNSGRCIEMYYNSIGSTVCGFTVKNGSAFGEITHSGGAFYLRYSVVNIINCVIDSNIASGYGGGIHNSFSDTYLSGVIVKNNYTYGRGGGISRSSGSISFDSINLCNIYLNYAAIGTDISTGDGPLHVFADTFTVLEPDYYYMYSDSFGYAVNDITWKINAGKIQQSYQDLYVSPEGDNTNSGFSPNEPLKSISYALLKMASDTNSPDTMHIANGYYALSTGEKFPLSLKAEVSLIGEDRDSVILDGEDEIYLFRGIMYADNYAIQNMTIQHGNGDKNDFYSRGAFHIFENRNAKFENMIFRENTGAINSSGVIMNSNGFKVINTIFKDNIGGKTFRTHHARQDIQYDTIEVINCKFINNTPNYSIPSHEGGSGGALSVVGHEQAPVPNLFNTVLFNCLFIENHTRNHPYGGMSSTAIGFIRNSRGYISNCTFGSNSSDNVLGANIGVIYNSNLSLYNSILYHNNPAELYMYTDTGNTNLSVYNSVVQGGEEGIRIYTPGNIVYYDPSNIDTDPMFDTASMFPYSLSAGSPCIDAGTLDLPPGIELPETDLAGNPRVYNGYVDMGAYEYGPWVTLPDYNSKLNTQNPKLLKAWPNPFRFETTVSYISPEEGHTSIRIYNIRGKHVKTMLDVQGLPGNGIMKWNGKDQNGNVLKAGTYIIRIIINGRERDAIKVVKR